VHLARVEWEDSGPERANASQREGCKYPKPMMAAIEEEPAGKVQQPNRDQ
jgi:hypothetical protein